LERNSRPTWRDFVGALTNDEVMRAVNGIPVLRFPKRIIEKSFSGAYAWMQSRRREVRSQGEHNRNEASSRAAPAPWLADIFGPIGIEYSSEKAKRILGWRPIASLDDGIGETSAWLAAMNISSCDCD
jgi:hypothetical protein